MKNYIDGIDFHNLEAQKYWTPPASYSEEKKKQEITSAIFSGNYIGSRKMDGAFYKFLKDEDGNMELIGRSKGVGGDYLDKLDHVPHLMPFFNSLPNGTCLIGEIYFPNNEGSNKVTTIMGCLTDKAIARQEKGEKLHYYIFDVLAWNGQSLYKKNIEERIKYLHTISEFIIVDFEPNVETAQYFEGEELWTQLQEILTSGGEGVVITKKGTCYQPGKRPAHQSIKVKKELKETLDVVVMGANPPTHDYNGKEILGWRYWENTYTGEKLEGTFYKDFCDGRPISPVTKAHFYNWAGSLVVGAMKDGKAVQVGNLSGLTEEVLANWRDYVGKVAEITGMQIMETGGVRHPKFVQWRPDLTPHDTDWYRIFGGVTK